MLKRGEVDIAYSIRGALAQELTRTPGLTLKPVAGTFTEWLSLTEQWDPKSPWHDQRVRLAANLAINRKALNEAEYLGHGRLSASIIPRDLQFAWSAPAYPYDPDRARRPVAEAVVNDLQTVGIRARLRVMERAGYLKTDTEKGFRHVVRVGSAAAGNAATRIEAFVLSGGVRSYGGYPDIDALYQDQAREMDAKKREAILHRIQQLVHEKAMFAPIVEAAFLNGHGARVAEPGLGLIVGHLYSAPYEDLRLKK